MSHAIAGARIIRRKLSTLIYDSPLLKHTQNKKKHKRKHNSLGANTVYSESTVVCCSVLHCSMLRCAEVCCRIHTHLESRSLGTNAVYSSVLQRAAACCDALQCVVM